MNKVSNRISNLWAIEIIDVQKLKQLKFYLKLHIFITMYYNKYLTDDKINKPPGLNK